tara:strand:+ start:8635 stop:8892 length:258 start_codon:yes stop_codon:yes gene_type:complete
VIEMAIEHKELLTEAVYAYLDDNESPVSFYKDLRAILESRIDYHNRQKSQVSDILKMVNGHRPLTMETDLPEDVMEYRSIIPARY